MSAPSDCTAAAREAQAKLRAERKAEKENQRKQAFGYFSQMAKGDWIKLAGGGNDVWLSWHEKFDCPWPDGPTVDAIELIPWLREMVAAMNKRMLKRGWRDGNDDLLTRKQRAEAEKAELQVDQLRGELYSLAEVHADFTRWAGAIRTVIEGKPPEIQEAIAEALELVAQECDGKYAAAAPRQHEQRSLFSDHEAEPPANPSIGLYPADPADAPGICGEIRCS